jgi:hypothetical protein
VPFRAAGCSEHDSSRDSFLVGQHVAY